MMIDDRADLKATLHGDRPALSDVRRKVVVRVAGLVVGLPFVRRRALERLKRLICKASSASFALS